MSNTTDSKKNRSPIWIIILIILIIAKIWIRNERKESEKSSRQMSELIQKVAANQDSYLNLKLRILNLSFNDISVAYKKNKVIAVLYDLGLDSNSIATIAITIDSTASILVPNKDNKIYKASDKGILDVSDSIFIRAEKLLPQMELFDNKIIKPSSNQIKVYVRTNNLRTYVHEIDIKEKNKTAEEKMILNGFTSLWSEMTKE